MKREGRRGDREAREGGDEIRTALGWMEATGGAQGEERQATLLPEGIRQRPRGRKGRRAQARPPGNVRLGGARHGG